MKFTKQEFSEELKKKLTDNGKKQLVQSERTFKASVERIFKRLEKAEDDSELDDVVADYLPDFQEIEGNMRKDNSEFVRKWEKEHEEKGNPEPNDDNKKRDDNANNGSGAKGDLAELLKRMGTIEDLLAKQKLNDTIADKKKQLKKALKKEGVEDDEWIDKYLAKLSINEDTDIDEEKEDAISLFNLNNSQIPKNVNTKNPSGKGQDEFDLSDLEINN